MTTSTTPTSHSSWQPQPERYWEEAKSKSLRNNAAAGNCTTDASWKRRQLVALTAFANLSVSTPRVRAVISPGRARLRGGLGDGFSVGEGGRRDVQEGAAQQHQFIIGARVGDVSGAAGHDAQRARQLPSSLALTSPNPPTPPSPRCGRRRVVVARWSRIARKRLGSMRTLAPEGRSQSNPASCRDLRYGWNSADCSESLLERRVRAAVLQQHDTREGREWLGHVRLRLHGFAMPSRAGVVLDPGRLLPPAKPRWLCPPLPQCRRRAPDG